MLYSRIKVVSELVNAAGAPRYGEREPARGLGLVTQVVVASKTGECDVIELSVCKVHSGIAITALVAIIQNRRCLDSLRRIVEGRAFQQGRCQAVEDCMLCGFCLKSDRANKYVFHFYVLHINCLTDLSSRTPMNPSRRSQYQVPFTMIQPCIRCTPCMRAHDGAIAALVPAFDWSQEP